MKENAIVPELSQAVQKEIDNIIADGKVADEIIRLTPKHTWSEYYIEAIKEDKINGPIALAQVIGSFGGAIGDDAPVRVASWLDPVLLGLRLKKAVVDNIPLYDVKFKRASGSYEPGFYRYRRVYQAVIAPRLFLHAFKESKCNNMFAFLSVVKCTITDWYSAQNVSFLDRCLASTYPVADIFPNLSLNQIEALLEILKRDGYLDDNRTFSEHGMASFATTTMNRLGRWITPERIINCLIEIENNTELKVEDYPNILRLAQANADLLKENLGALKKERSYHKFVLDGRIVPLALNGVRGFFGGRGFFPDAGVLKTLGLEDNSCISALKRVSKQGVKYGCKNDFLNQAPVDLKYFEKLTPLMQYHPEVFNNKNVVLFLLEKMMPYLLKHNKGDVPQKWFNYFIGHKDTLRAYVLQEISRDSDQDSVKKFDLSSPNAYVEIVSTFRPKPVCVPGCFYKQPRCTRTSSDIKRAIDMALTELSGLGPNLDLMPMR